MKSPITLLVASAATFGAVVASSTPPQLTYLFTANITVSPPINVGPLPQGQTVVFPVTGGTFTGPRLSGKVAPVGADIATVTPSGLFAPNALSIFQTTDGANIIFREQGFQNGNYIYAAGTFQTGSTKYDWLNTAVVITRAPVPTTRDSGVLIDFFQAG